MTTYRTKGIIIKKINFKEADKIVTILTRNLGKITAIAHGVRKSISKLAGHLELFMLSDLVLEEGKNLDTVTSAQNLQSFKNIRKDLRKASEAYYIGELVNKFLPEKYKDTRMFNLLVGTFTTLDDNRIDSETKILLIRLAFELKLLDLLGFAPQLIHCLHCGQKLKPERNYFSLIMGGILCFNCRVYDRQAQNILPETIKILRILLDQDFGFILRIKIDSNLLNETAQVVDNYVRFILEKNLKSADFVKHVQSLNNKEDKIT